MENKEVYSDDFLNELCDPENINIGLKIASRILGINDNENISNLHILIAVAALKFFMEKQCNDAFVEPGVFDYMFETASILIREIDKKRK